MTSHLPSLRSARLAVEALVSIRFPEISRRLSTEMSPRPVRDVQLLCVCTFSSQVKIVDFVNDNSQLIVNDFVLLKAQHRLCRRATANCLA